MKRPRDLAERYLLVARRDLVAFRGLLSLPEIADETLGFHAQQAIEKSLKAVLSLHGIPFRAVHDLQTLLDALTQSNLAPPPHAALLDNLTPYAVLLPYEFTEERFLDRALVAAVVEDVFRWALKQVDA
jgi:HEPN domain-containing protein